MFYMFFLRNISFLCVTAEYFRCGIFSSIMCMFIQTYIFMYIEIYKFATAEQFEREDNLLIRNVDLKTPLSLHVLLTYY